MVIHANNKIGKKYVKENFTFFLPTRKNAEIKKIPNKKLLIAIEIGKVINNNNKGIKAFFWTKTEFDAKMAVNRALRNDGHFVHNFTNKGFGYSVRCIK